MVPPRRNRARARKLLVEHPQLRHLRKLRPAPTERLSRPAHAADLIEEQLRRAANQPVVVRLCDPLAASQRERHQPLFADRLSQQPIDLRCGAVAIGRAHDARAAPCQAGMRRRSRSTRISEAAAEILVWTRSSARVGPWLTARSAGRARRRGARTETPSRPSATIRPPGGPRPARTAPRRRPTSAPPPFRRRTPRPASGRSRRRGTPPPRRRPSGRPAARSRRRGEAGSRRDLQPAGVGFQEALLHVVALFARAATEAAHLGQRAVQLDDPTAAGAVVQAIDVLGDHAGQRPGRLQRRQRAVGGVGRGGPEARPADGGARPVALPDLTPPQKGVVLDRVARAGPARRRGSRGCRIRCCSRRR